MRVGMNVGDLEDYHVVGEDYRGCGNERGDVGRLSRVCGGVNMVMWKDYCKCVVG